jgi:arginine-tRNA-protein transferase
MQQAIFTCRFLFQEGMLSTAVWLRLPLQGYSFSKSLRKMMNRNSQRFDVYIGPAVIDAEKELLFGRYKSGFKGRLSDSLYNSLGLGRENIIYSSMQTEIREDGKLIAFSIFDCGDEAIQSVSGIYDPEYADYSLGLFTMVLEVEYGLKNGYTYFYPGYIAPGRPVFEYKLRTKGTEFYEPDQDRWFPIALLEREQLPSAIMDQALDVLKEELMNLSIDHEKYVYPPH